MAQQTRETWIVGHDGSAGAQHAAEWAVNAAAGRHVDLAMTRAWHVPAFAVAPLADSVEDFAPTTVGDGFDELAERAAAAGVEVVERIVEGAASATLLEASEHADLVVVGSRGRGGFARLLLGSVGTQCATHAVVPTVVVPAHATVDQPLRRIVVGLDGSDRSRRALAWAQEFAPADCTITVVGAWAPSRSGYVAVVQSYTHELREARETFHEILDELEAAAGHTLFERRFEDSDPGGVLLDEAARADLLVVGKRGHSGVNAVLLGSVSTHVLHHSPCAVAVIPDPTDAV